jgi:RNA polymerase sigma-70 factor (ECF subfamily)
MSTHPPDEPWTLCYEELAPRLLLFARQWLASPADAEDVVQAAFVKFWQHQPNAPREHWPLLYAAVRSTALDHLRGADRRRHRETQSEVALAEEDSPFFDQPAEAREEAELAEKALRDLPVEQREVLVLRVWGGLTFAEIAATLDESINTVAARHRYALEALRKKLKPYAHERI